MRKKLEALWVVYTIWRKISQDPTYHEEGLAEMGHAFEAAGL